MAEKVVLVGIKKETGYLYFVDKDGDISRAKMSRSKDIYERTKEEPKDKINHPPHYTQGKFETVQVIEDWELGYHLGNALKYISRYKHKHKTKTKQLEDLRKAIWFIERKIKSIEG